MPILDSVIVNLAVALGIGLLIGAERERRKGKGPSRSPAGIRTFAVASLAGAISFATGGEILLAVTTAGAIILTALAYFRSRSDDPGLTSEIALILTVLLGGLSMRQPVLAAGVAVTLAALLASRTRLHHFVRSVLTERELTDGLIFAGATLVVLPLLPDQQIGPYGALNPRSIWIIVILVMAISAAGYILVRILGNRFGLAIAGLASGFISSVATIGAMGTRAKTTPAVLGAAVAGAVLSTVATIVQMCRRSRGHEHGRTAGAVDPAVLRRSGGGVLRRVLHDQGLARDGAGRFSGRARIQFFVRHYFSVDLVRDSCCLSGFAGKLRRNRCNCWCCIGRFCGYAFGGRLDCFAGRVREVEFNRRNFPNPCRVVDQHDQQDHRRMDQWWTTLRVAIDPGVAAGHIGGMGGDICSATGRTVIGGALPSPPR